MTEVGVTHANIRDKFKHNSVGKLLELVEMKVSINLKVKWVLFGGKWLNGIWCNVRSVIQSTYFLNTVFRCGESRLC